ncbi:flavin monoamine oxidase family protein [Gloeobacter violaceus]|uniref:flavin monoamine oxidase family protein n=1 Tax=Gloeobacter violaceus TaxID=33072 RepID=UPI0013E8B156|nr:NAD(P)/FAD-dependent oxidoreductase [Gloeobacter violaceus]
MLAYSCVGEFGLEPERLSALNVLSLFGMADEEEDERYRIAQGSDSVPRTIAARLRRPITFGCTLEALRAHTDGSYRLVVHQNGGVQEIQADRVVLALPFTMLRRVELQVELPPRKRRAIAELGYGTNVKLIAGFQRRLWRKQKHTGLTLGDSYLLSWEASTGQPGSAGLLTNYLGGEAGAALLAKPLTVRAETFVEHLDQIFVGLAAQYTGKAARYGWPQAPFIQASYSCYLPGQYTEIAGCEAEAVGGIHFAGEHTSLSSQGYMNGACESGERAAREVLTAIR